MGLEAIINLDEIMEQRQMERSAAGTTVVSFDDEGSAGPIADHITDNYNVASGFTKEMVMDAKYSLGLGMD